MRVNPVNMVWPSQEAHCPRVGMLANVVQPWLLEVCSMAASVIVAGARTPIGKLLGSLKGFAAVDLGGVAIGSALERAGIAGDQVDYVVMGQVLQAGAGQITARQAAVKGGIPMTV